MVLVRRLQKYLQPSLLSLPTYLGLVTFALILLYMSYQIQQVAKELRTAKSAIQRDQPAGKIYASKTSVANNLDSLILTADAWPKEGQIEYVRYYLLNPTLGVNNDWGGPNWCSCGRVCSVADTCTLKTWDLSESGDTKRRYQITWGAETTSGISTQVSRKLNPVNVPAGEYDIYIQVKDTAGNMNEAADMVRISVTNAENVLGAQSIPSVKLSSCAEVVGENLYSFSWLDTNRGPLPTEHYYQLDQGPWIPVEDNSLTLSFPSSGEHVFAIQVVDGANHTASAKCTFSTKSPNPAT